MLALSHCRRRSREIARPCAFRLSDINIEPGLEIRLQIGTGILRDVLSPDLTLERGNTSGSRHGSSARKLFEDAAESW